MLLIRIRPFRGNTQLSEIIIVRARHKSIEALAEYLTDSGCLYLIIDNYCHQEIVDALLFQLVHKRKTVLVDCLNKLY